jgi:hypothetical protein
MAGITMPPQFRESPETANFHGAVEGCCASRQPASGVSSKKEIGLIQDRL